jgi:hypothetical protein
MGQNQKSFLRCNFILLYHTRFIFTILLISSATERDAAENEPATAKIVFALPILNID